MDRPAATQALIEWAREHGAPFAVEGPVVRIHLLPADFGTPPAATLRELEADPFDLSGATEGRAGASA
ncbi:MAG: hypothetical protein AAF211_27700 [Myxococcota bacterium]